MSSNKEETRIAMLDTSFLIRLLKEDEPLHLSAKSYYQYLLENLDHAELAGKYAGSLFKARDKGQYSPDQRQIISNDTKIFAQASSIGALYFVTADTNASKAIDILAKENNFEVTHMDIHFPLSSYFGTLF